MSDMEDKVLSGEIIRNLVPQKKEGRSVQKRSEPDIKKGPDLSIVNKFVSDTSENFSSDFLKD